MKVVKDREFQLAQFMISKTPEYIVEKGSVFLYA